MTRRVLRSANMTGCLGELGSIHELHLFLDLLDPTNVVYFILKSSALVGSKHIQVDSVRLVHCYRPV